MNSSHFKRSQLKHLCSIIGCLPGEIEYITDNLDDYYKEWVENKVDKTSGDFKKYKDGTIKQRTIRPSLNRLKVIQSSIKNKILSTIPLPENIHGGVKGKNNITNAKVHQGNKYQFTTDLQNFYPSINCKQVYKMFLSLEYSNHFAHWLTKLTTWKNELPQGTPTSTHIANLVFLESDYLLIPFCENHNITYTRYVDDLTFSSQKDFKLFLPELLQIINNGGFKLNYRKTKYQGDQTVTGIEVFNNYIDGPEKIKDKVKVERESDSNNKPYTNYLNRIRRTNKTGKHNY